MRPTRRWVEIAYPVKEPKVEEVIADVLERGGLVLK